MGLIAEEAKVCLLVVLHVVFATSRSLHVIGVLELAPIDVAMVATP